MSTGLSPNAASPRGRILCVTSNFPRWEGDSTTPFVLHLAQDLQAIGWQVDVLAPHAPGSARREVLGGIQVERFRYFWPEDKQTVCYQGGAMVNLRKRPMEKLKLPLLVAAEFFAIARRLFSHRYQVLHSHWVLPQGFTGMLASRLTRVPHVITVHGGDIFSLRSSLMTRLKRAALHAASSVTVNSSFTRKATSEVAEHIADMQQIPMGVDAGALTERETALATQLRAHHRVGDAPLLIFVGRLVEEKGGEDAIRAVQLLKESMPDIRLLILGEGQDRPALEQLTHAMELQEQVHFLGWVAPSDVRAYMASADVFVGPSRAARDGWVEAQGLTFLEAMAVGTPVIASRLGGIIDSVEHEHTGLLVDERSPQQIAQAAQRLADDPALKIQITQAALDRVASRFSRSISANAFSAIFDRLQRLSTREK